MHPIIDELPEVRAAEAEMERLRARQRLVSAAASRDGAELTRLRDEHTRAVEDALDRGEIPPPRPDLPPPPDYVSQLHQISSEMQRARDRRRAAVAEAAPELRRRIEDELRAIAGEAAGVLAAHGDLRERWSELMAARSAIPGTPPSVQSAHSWQAIVGEALR